MYRYSLLMVFIVMAATVAAQEKYPTKTIEPLYDISLTDAERDSLKSNIEGFQKEYQALHQYKLDNSVGMALKFDPRPKGFQIPAATGPGDWALPKNVTVPANKDELAFYPVYKLAALIKSKKITSTELTSLYISRIKKYSDTLQCVISLLEERAMRDAKKADEEIAKGKYKGPLHGIPYGVKDLLAVEGTKTTWGAAPFKDQSIDRTAEVVKKLEASGAVLICKFTMGALAMGDIWYGGVTKNPWNMKQGSSGSSAGSASGTAAGLVAFSIGTETLGSIVSPSTRCGASGLRPTYGNVSTDGAMTLSWSMDKIGPICRSALDCGLVLQVIGSNVLSYPRDIRKLKVAYLKTSFESKYPTRANDSIALKTIRNLGIEPEAVELPSGIPTSAIRIMLTAEAGAAFDELTRTNIDDQLTDQRKGAWPNTFRASRFIPAVEYINASRARTQLIEEYHAKLGQYDVIISPSFANGQLLTTNLTGHPCLVVPNGFNDQGSPTSISFLGKLYGEAALVAFARAYQEASEWDEKVPPLFAK
ncbi:MAG TPA: amidase [Cyclobacteriaceae bacterium]|nr:amidase [Cyclobacteriaceae bacterium]